MRADLDAQRAHANIAPSLPPCPCHRRKKEKKRRSRSRSRSLSAATPAAKRPRTEAAVQPADQQPSSRMSAEELLAWEAAARLAAGDSDAAAEAEDPGYDPDAYDWEGWLDT